MSVQQSSREYDANILRILQLRIQYGATRTARHVGLRPERVRTICNRILRDDLNTSVKYGMETADKVRAAYWSFE
jgi:hypothetical protein